MARTTTSTTMTPQMVRFLCEEVLEDKARLVPTYGNTLMGLACSLPPASELRYSVTYFAPQPRAATRRARHEAHVALDLVARAVGIGLGVPALHPRHDAFVFRGVRTLAPVAVLVPNRHLLAARAVEHQPLVGGLHLLPRRVGGEPVRFRDRRQHALVVLAAESRPR